MENQGIMNKIKSIYIIHNIFNYIIDSNLQLKLFIYSKYFQNKLNIKFIYKEKYLKKIGFNLEDYLFSDKEEYIKDFLRKKYENFIIDNKLNKVKFEDILYEVLENKKIKDIDEEEVNKINKDSEKLIDINSPLFEIISKTKILEKYFSIYISQDIESNESKKYYIYINKLNKSNNDFRIFFDKINKSNIQYSSIFYNFDKMNKIYNLKEFNIDFNKIKKLTLNVNCKLEFGENINSNIANIKVNPIN